MHLNHPKLPSPPLLPSMEKLSSSKPVAGANKVGDRYPKWVLWGRGAPAAGPACLPARLGNSLTGTRKEVTASLASPSAPPSSPYFSLTHPAVVATVMFSVGASLGVAGTLGRTLSTTLAWQDHQNHTAAPSLLPRATDDSIWGWALCRAQHACATALIRGSPRP